MDIFDQPEALALMAKSKRKFLEFTNSYMVIMGNLVGEESKRAIFSVGRSKFDRQDAMSAGNPSWMILLDSKMKYINALYKLTVGLSLVGAATSQAQELVGKAGGLDLIVDLCIRDEDMSHHSKLVRCALCALGVSVSLLLSLSSKVLTGYHAPLQILCDRHSMNLNRLLRLDIIPVIKSLLDQYADNHGVLHDACVVLFVLVQGDTPSQFGCSMQARQQCLDCAIIELLMTAQRHLPASSPTFHTIASIISAVSAVL